MTATPTHNREGEPAVSTTELPRPISFEEIQVGDTVALEWNDRGVQYGAKMTVASRATARLDSAESGSLISLDGTAYGATWTLLDRSVKRPAVLDAEVGTLWTDTDDDSLWCKTDDYWSTRDQPCLSLVRPTEDDPGQNLEAMRRRYPRLVPFAPPSVDAELERLRSNVIEHAKACSRSNWLSLGLHAAVRALRDHQVGAS